MPSGTGATKSGCKVTTIFPNHQTFSRFFLLFSRINSHNYAYLQASTDEGLGVRGRRVRGQPGPTDSKKRGHPQRSECPL